MEYGYQDIFNESSLDSDVVDATNASIVNLKTNNISSISGGSIISSSSISAPLFVGNLQGNATSATTAANFTGSLSGDIIGTQSATQIAAGVIINADINSAAGIQDSKLATISTSGKVSNSATTATASNTNNSIMCRDSAGNFNASGAYVSGVANTGYYGLQDSTPVTRFNIGLDSGNFWIWRYGASGNYIGQCINIDNSSGVVSIIISLTTPSITTNNLAAGTVSVLSGSAGANAMYNIGRAVNECILGISSGPSQIMTGSVAGDLVVDLIDSTKTLRFGTTTGAWGTVNSSGFNGSLTGNVTGNCTGSSSSFTGFLSGVVTGTQAATTIIANAITNTMLATINTAGKVLNSATTATASNTASAIVARDTNGRFVATGITLNSNTAISINTGNNSSGAINILTGNNSYYVSMQMGRVNPEVYMALAAANDQFALGSLPGDLVIGNISGSHTFFTVAGVGTPSLTLQTNGVASTSSSTGTAVIIGGLGVGGNIYSSGTLGGLNSTLTAGTASTSPTTGTLIVTGGVGVSGTINSSGVACQSLAVNAGGSSSTSTISLLSGASNAYTSLTIGKTAPELELGVPSASGNFMSDCVPGDVVIRSDNGGTPRILIGVGTAHSAVAIASSVNTSTSPTTGSMVVTGGVGITGNLNVSGTISGTIPATYVSGVLHYDDSITTYQSTSYYTLVSLTAPSSHTYLFGWTATGNGGIANQRCALIASVFVGASNVKLFTAVMMGTELRSYTDTGTLTATAGQVITLQTKVDSAASTPYTASVSFWMIPIA